MTWPHSQLITLIPASLRSVGEDSVGLERELDEPRWQRGLGDAVGLEPSGLARHPRHVPARTAFSQGIVGLAQASRAESDERVEHRRAEKLNRVSREEQRHLVTAVLRRSGDQEGKGRPRRVLGPVCDVDEDLCHARDSRPEPLS